MKNITVTDIIYPNVAKALRGLDLNSPEAADVFADLRNYHEYEYSLFTMEFPNELPDTLT